MKSMYHICYSSHDEILYRSEEDFDHGYNCQVTALARTDSQLLAESQMSDHSHKVELTDSPKELVRSERTSYNMYFNRKYCRTGPLGENGYFCIELQGYQHKLAAIIYTIRNAVHHGVVSTAFQYPYTSANCYFRKELGKMCPDQYTLSPEEIRKALPRGAAFDDGFKMNASGIFLRDSVTEVKMVESMFASPAAFLFLIGRKSGADWEREQMNDDCPQPPITISSVESALSQALSPEEWASFLEKCRKNEFGRFSPYRISDLDLCRRIDRYYVPHFGKDSVYLLDDRQKREITYHLLNDDKARPSQIRRALIFKSWDEAPEWFLRMTRR